jgi:hypothetical protein
MQSSNAFVPESSSASASSSSSSNGDFLLSLFFILVVDLERHYKVRCGRKGCRQEYTVTFPQTLPETCQFSHSKNHSFKAKSVDLPQTVGDSRNHGIHQITYQSGPSKTH